MLSGQQLALYFAKNAYRHRIFTTLDYDTAQTKIQQFFKTHACSSLLPTGYLSAMNTVSKLLLVLCIFTILVGCSTTLPKSPSRGVNYKETGKASFYANKYQSRKTANGERFDQNLKTAAHKKLPFGTLVKVTNLNNSKSVIVRINDRGPFVKGRIIDLSRSAFSSIGNTRLGVLNVGIEVLD